MNHGDQWSIVRKHLSRMEDGSTESMAIADGIASRIVDDMVIASGLSEHRDYAELLADYQELRKAAIAVLSGSLRTDSPGMADALCALEREVYTEGQSDEAVRRERALRHLHETTSFLLHLHGVAYKAQLEWEQQPTPGDLTYTDVIVRAVVAEMVRLGRGGVFPGHFIVDEYDLKALLSAAHSLPVSQWPVSMSLDVMRRIEKVVGHD